MSHGMRASRLPGKLEPLSGAARSLLYRNWGRASKPASRRSIKPPPYASNMAEPHRLLGVYLHLARASEMRLQPMVRDKLLVLAGVQAETMGLAPISALCRHKVLAHNGRHMLRRWPTLELALDDERFRVYLKQLTRRYSKEKAEHMLHSLGIELGRERELYANDLEYAAALLDTEPDAIDDILVQDPSDLSATSRRWPSGGDHSHATNGASHGRDHRASRLRDLLVVWGPFFLGATVLVGAAVLSITSGR